MNVEPVLTHEVIKIRNENMSWKRDLKYMQEELRMSQERESEADELLAAAVRNGIAAPTGELHMKDWTHVHHTMRRNETEERRTRGIEEPLIDEEETTELFALQQENRRMRDFVNRAQSRVRAYMKLSGQQLETLANMKAEARRNALGLDEDTILEDLVNPE